jgi:hypothetical protein
MHRPQCVWIGDLLELVIAPGEAALLSRLLAAAEEADGLASPHGTRGSGVARTAGVARGKRSRRAESLLKLSADSACCDPPALQR